MYFMSVLLCIVQDIDGVYLNIYKEKRVSCIRYVLVYRIYIIYKEKGKVYLDLEMYSTNKS